MVVGGVSLRDDIQRKGHVNAPSPKCMPREDPSRHGQHAKFTQTRSKGTLKVSIFFL